MKRIYFFLFILLCTNCTQKLNKTENEDLKTGEVEVKYAEGFNLFTTADGYILEVTRPFPESSDTLAYTFTRTKDIGIHIPVEKLVCTSTTHLPMLVSLGGADALKGFPTLDYISSAEIRDRINNGKVTDIGNVQEINLEKLLELAPDLIVNYSMDDMRSTERMESLGLSVILNGDYLENHPLGRAEWIKVFGVLMDEVELAESIFNDIERTYVQTADLATPSSDCAFSGSLYGDSWFMPGGNNYGATLLRDAGFQYVVEDSSNGFLQWGYENVFELAQDCDYWISPAPFEDLDALGQADARYVDFEAFKSGNVYTYDAKIGATGGNEYLELGYLRPDLILKDLLKIREPELLPEHEFYFYRKLKP